MRHGTRYAWFEKGCRCDECREGRLADDRARRRRRFERAKADPSIIKHGTAGGYTDYGCRCDQCREANKIENRRQRGNAPARTWTDEQVTAALALYIESGPRPAAELVGVVPSTITKWATARGLRYGGPPQVHGTVHSYTRLRCRCDQCVEGYHRIMAEQKAKRHAEKERAPHGTESGYTNWGCRCEPCRTADHAYQAASRQRAKDRRKSHTG